MPAVAERQSRKKALYERNARDLITLWGNADSPLHEYSCRQWSGLLNDFYKVRWQKFFAETEKAMTAGKEMDVKALRKRYCPMGMAMGKSTQGFSCSSFGQ